MCTEPLYSTLYKSHSWQVKYTFLLSEAHCSYVPFPSFLLPSSLFSTFFSILSLFFDLRESVLTIYHNILPIFILIVFLISSTQCKKGWRKGGGVENWEWSTYMLQVLVKVVKKQENLTELTKWKCGKSGKSTEEWEPDPGTFSYNILKNPPSLKITTIHFEYLFISHLTILGFHMTTLFWHTALIPIPIFIFASWSVPPQCTFFTPIPVKNVHIFCNFGPGLIPVALLPSSRR